MGGELTPKEIIDNTRVVLMKNVVLTDELEKQLKKHNVIGDTTMKELKECTNQNDRNEKLLHQLSIRGRIAIENFCDALQLSGFNLLSDMLRDQLVQQEGGAVDIADLGKRAPRVDRALDRREKDDLMKYIQYKVHESSLKEQWQRNTNEKEKALVAKQRQLEESWKFTEILKDKDDTITQMSEQLELAFKDAESKGVHMQHMNQYLQTVKKKHEEDMKIQMRYNQANDNSLKRKTQIHGDMEKELAMITVQINETLRSGGQLKSPNPDSHEEEMVITSVDKVKYALKQLLSHTRELQEIKVHYDKLSQDCYYVLSHLGTDVNADLRESFQSFIVETEEVNTSLRNKIEMLKREIEQKEASIRENNENANNKYRDLESQMEEYLSNGLQKEAKIKALMAENDKLKKAIAQLEKQLISKQQTFGRRPSTPRFKDYLENHVKTPDPMMTKKSQSPAARETPHRKPQQSLSLPSINKKDRRLPVYGAAGSVPVSHSLAATKTQDISMYHKTRNNGFNSGNPFIVQSIHTNAGSKAKPVGTYQSTYGKQHSVEVEMKKNVPYYR